MIRKTIGPFQVVAKLGEGGMGEVYRARDTRLDRTVAIKVLPAHVSADLGRRTRCGREAKTLAELNHPDVCALHDIGREGDIDFLAMEYAKARRAEIAPDCRRKQGTVHRELSRRWRVTR